MGMIQTEQAIRIIEAVRQPEMVELAKEVTTKPESNYWYIPIIVALITVVGGIITACLRRRK